jgi:hypothetical protein
MDRQDEQDKATSDLKFQILSILPIHVNSLSHDAAAPTGDGARAALA